MTTYVHLSYYTILLFLIDSTSPLSHYVDVPTYRDPHDRCQSLKNHFQLVIEFRYIPGGVHVSTWTWNPCLQWRLGYFNMVYFISTWYPSSPVYFNTMVHTYPWDCGMWLYALITSVEDNTFITGRECSVAREVVGALEGP